MKKSKILGRQLCNQQGSVSLTGKDSIILDENRILTDLADGDTAVLDFPNNVAEAKVGKNGNTIFAFNATGKTVTVTMRVIRASADDKYLNQRLAQYINDPAGFSLFVGEFIKRVGDGEGNVTNDVYLVDGGIIQKIPNVKENVEGDTEQSVAIYQFIFANTSRSLG